MKASKMLIGTLKETPNDAVISSHIYLIRAGMIRKLVAGVYNYLPLGLRTLHKIEEIIRDEMDNAGALEILSSALQPKELWEESGRWQKYGPELMRFKDRNDRDFCLGPTHEEIFTDLIRNELKSRKNLPINIYQIQTKYRDEMRPRFGLMRGREFIMKDAYSFDRDEAGLDKSYQIMKDAYNRIYTRLGIDYKIVKADCGAMGGTLSEEFQAITDIGEDTIVLCDKCDFSSNLEIATTISNNKDNEAEKELEMVHTPHQETIEDVCNFLNIDVKKSVKALLMNANDELVVLFVRGDRELCENKVCKLLGINELNFADDALIATSNAVPGYTGPIGLNCKVVVDNEVLNMKNFCCGANKEEYHYINANVKDIKYDIAGDIVNVQEGDTCPECGGKLYFKKGIEIGNLFKLGTKYAEKLGLTYLDENNKEQTVVMGCYGIGQGRILASLIEQTNDEYGLVLPMNIAPYHVALVQIDMKNEEQSKIANEIYDKLTAEGIEVIFDDRDERPGVKFKDMELIGIPARITVGKKITDNLVEFKERATGNGEDISIDEVVEKVVKYVKDNLK